MRVEGCQCATNCPRQVGTKRVRHSTRSPRVGVAKSPELPGRALANTRRKTHARTDEIAYVGGVRKKKKLAPVVLSLT